MSKKSGLSINTYAKMVVPSSGISAWKEVLAAGILDTADTNPNKPQAITNFEADRLFTLDHGRGTIILAEMARTGTLTGDPVVRLFGRFDLSQHWSAIANKNGTLDVTLARDDTNDTVDADGVSHTLATDDTSWDTHGFNEFAFVVVTAATSTGGEAATATLNAKVI